MTNLLWCKYSLEYLQYFSLQGFIRSACTSIERVQKNHLKNLENLLQRWQLCMDKSCLPMVKQNKIKITRCVALDFFYKWNMTHGLVLSYIMINQMQMLILFCPFQAVITWYLSIMIIQHRKRISVTGIPTQLI